VTRELRHNVKNALKDFTNTMSLIEQRRRLLGALATLPFGAMPSARANESAASASASASAASTASPTEEVPYVQTPMHVVHRMLQLADVTANDVLWDLGSGDGRIVIAAAKRGANATGFEIDPNLIRESVRSARLARVASRAKFLERDLFTLNFATPNVVTLYLLPEFNLKLRPLFLSQMKPGARIVSHEWDMGDWLPDETLLYPSAAKPHGTSKEHKVFLWIVPAQIAGRWRISIAGRDAFVVNIAQHFQKITFETNSVPIAWASLRGRTLRFALRDGAKRIEYEGRVAADARSIHGSGWGAVRSD
jgi:hypothetical protein